MCKAAGEPGGPRRCSADARRGLQRSTAEVALLTQRRHQMSELPILQPGLTMVLPPGVREAVDVAATAGTPFIVGGAVRDGLLGGDPKDFDLEVHGTSLDDLAQHFAAAGWEVDEVGRQFGVLKVGRPGEEVVDVAVPRRDNKTGSGHRGFTVDTGGSMSVAEAASRRDFTINAIYYDPRAGALVDPFGGVADLEGRVLQHVSDGFGEDPLRVLRGVQFAGRFAMEIHPDTAALCRSLRPHFAELATERVQLEWAKLYVSPHPDKAVSALQCTGWDDTLPGLKSALAQPTVARALTRMDSVSTADRVAVGAAAISSPMTTEDRAVFLAATVVGKDAATIAADLAATDPNALTSGHARKNHAHQLAKRGFTFRRYQDYAQVLGDTSAIAVAQAAVTEGLGDGPEPAWIQGRDALAAAGARKPGPWVGELVAAALQRQYRGEFTTREHALTWLRAAAAAPAEKV